MLYTVCEDLVSAPQARLSFLFGKTYLWMMYREIVANYYKHNPEYINVLCGQKYCFCVTNGGMYTNH